MPRSTEPPHRCITWRARSIMSFNTCLVAHGKWGKLRAGKHFTVLCWKLRHKDRLSPTPFSIRKSSLQYCCEKIHTELSKLAFYSIFLGSLQKSECTDFFWISKWLLFFQDTCKNKNYKGIAFIKRYLFFSCSTLVFFFISNVRFHSASWQMALSLFAWNVLCIGGWGRESMVWLKF